MQRNLTQLRSWIAGDMIWQVSIECSFLPPLPCKLLDLAKTPAVSAYWKKVKRPQTGGHTQSPSGVHCYTRLLHGDESRILILELAMFIESAPKVSTTTAPLESKYETCTAVSPPESVPEAHLPAASPAPECTRNERSRPGPHLSVSCRKRGHLHWGWVPPAQPPWLAFSPPCFSSAVA